MSDYLTLIEKFQRNSGIAKLHPRQIEASKALYAESIRNGVDPRLTLAMAWRESSWGGRREKEAIFIGDKSRGEDHALGYGQVLRSTAKAMGMESEWLAAKDKFLKTGEGDAEFSAKSMVKYIKNLQKQGGYNAADIASGYNGGIGRMKGAWNPKVKSYVAGVSELLGKFEDGKPVSIKQPAFIDTTARFAPLTPATGNELPRLPASTPPPSLPPMASGEADTRLAGGFAPRTNDVFGSGIFASQASATPQQDTTPQLDNEIMQAAGMNFDLSKEGFGLLPPLMPMQDDPRDTLRKKVAGLFDTEYGEYLNG